LSVHTIYADRAGVGLGAAWFLTGSLPLGFLVSRPGTGGADPVEWGARRMSRRDVFPINGIEQAIQSRVVSRDEGVASE